VKKRRWGTGNLGNGKESLILRPTNHSMGEREKRPAPERPRSGESITPAGQNANSKRSQSAQGSKGMKPGTSRCQKKRKKHKEMKTLWQDNTDPWNPINTRKSATTEKQTHLFTSDRHQGDPADANNQMGRKPRGRKGRKMGTPA